MKKKVMTVDSYIVHMICEWPTLYARSTFKVSAMKVMDQLLNVIGNGVRDSEELAEHLSFKATHTREEADLWIKNKIFYGYKEVEDSGFGAVCGKGDFVDIRGDQLKDHPEIIHTMFSPKNPFGPYPNFQKEYSTVWKCPAYLDLGKDWLRAAIEFYTYCRAWLKENESKYHYAFPRPTRGETIRFLKDVRRDCIKGKPWAQVCKDYVVPDAKNLHDLFTKRWKKERARIFAFIEETLQVLRDKIKE